MIVKCACCGPLPLEDLETLGKRAYAKHLRSCPMTRPLRCDNCGKPMFEHDDKAHCYPEHSDGSARAEAPAETGASLPPTEANGGS